ncbi:YwqJ-related putative deaminase [Lysinibacillus sp. NPDC048646]|uniref:YwqJ-related putative deaminase n=1 Tax=Lysinibacillus sp. NPDC048646 TaxID=3390574 RepID=UPI003D044B2D
MEKLKQTTSNNKLGPAFAGAYDKKTGEYYYALNDVKGNTPAMWAPQLEELFINAPESVKSSYKYTKGFASHAEVDAVNKALLANPNASIDDVLVNVIRTGQNKTKPSGMMFNRCPHCAYMLDGFEMISEVPKNGR